MSNPKRIKGADSEGFNHSKHNDQRNQRENYSVDIDYMFPSLNEGTELV